MHSLARQPDQIAAQGPTEINNGNVSFSDHFGRCVDQLLFFFRSDWGAHPLEFVWLRGRSRPRKFCGSLEGISSNSWSMVLGFSGATKADEGCCNGKEVEGY